MWLEPGSFDLNRVLRLLGRQKDAVCEACHGLQQDHVCCAAVVLRSACCPSSCEFIILPHIFLPILWKWKRDNGTRRVAPSCVAPYGSPFLLSSPALDLEQEADLNDEVFLLLLCQNGPGLDAGCRDRHDLLCVPLLVAVHAVRSQPHAPDHTSRVCSGRRRQPCRCSVGIDRSGRPTR